MNKARLYGEPFLALPAALQAVLPADKHDVDALSGWARLAERDRYCLVPFLLTWLQDYNWPVAPPVQALLAPLGADVVPFVRGVLESTDDVWKYWLVARLVPSLPGPAFDVLRPELERLASTPNAEEVDLVAAEGLARRAAAPGARVDVAVRVIAAPPAMVYAAFATAEALERWLPPTGMTGRVRRFDLREGGGYEMRLTCPEALAGHGKSSAHHDDVVVRFTRLDPPRGIAQEVGFVSDDPAFSGRMRMDWSFRAHGDGAMVTVRAEGVPVGIRHDQHEAGMAASLENLAHFVASRPRGRS